jgi:serine/threonine-protein kinase HipA
VKFPKPQGDDWNVMAWEASMLDAMSATGIDVPDHETRTLTVGGEPRTVLFLKRFDRTVAHARIPYFSALSALEARDGDGGDWLDLADFTRVNGGDTVELWRRGVFGHLVGNRDDHLRNHGFLRRGRDWQLSPAFDVNPTPLADGDAHELALFGNVAPDLAAWTADDTLSLFGVKQVQVTEFLDATRTALEKAPQRASAHGADQHSIAVMESRIENAVAQL